MVFSVVMIYSYSQILPSIIYVLHNVHTTKKTLFVNTKMCNRNLQPTCSVVLYDSKRKSMMYSRQKLLQTPISKNMFQLSKQNPFMGVKEPSLIRLIYNVYVIHGKL
jgi:hypothetical protein